MGAVHGVLVTYRRGEQLRDYFAGLAHQTRPLDTLLVVDNDPDGSASWIVENHGLKSTAVDYVLIGDNLGPAGGNAIGMERVVATAAEHDWIITLDDDDPPRTPEMIEVLERFGDGLLAAGRNVGGVGLCGGRFDADRGRNLKVGDAELVGPVPVSWVGGGQLPCYTVHAARAVGGFDKRFFFSFEDLDYGLRMQDHGFEMYAHGELWRREREHAGRHNTDLAPDRRLGEPGWRRYYSLRNLVFLLRQRGHGLVALRVAVLSLVKPVYNVPRSPKLAWAHLRLNFHAVADAYRGRMGRTIEPTPKQYERRA